MSAGLRLTWDMNLQALCGMFLVDVSPLGEEWQVSFETHEEIGRLYLKETYENEKQAQLAAEAWLLKQAESMLKALKPRRRG